MLSQIELNFVTLQKKSKKKKFKNKDKNMAATKKTRRAKSPTTPKTGAKFNGRPYACGGKMKTKKRK